MRFARPVDMNTRASSASDDEPTAGVSPDEELAEKGNPAATHRPGNLRQDRPEEGEQREDESVAQILAGVAGSLANPDLKRRWGAGRTVRSPPPIFFYERHIS